MPYSLPTPPHSSLSSTPSGSPPAPTRSLSSHTVPSYSFSNERSSGTFSPLSHIPRRSPGLVGNPKATSVTAKRFHFKSSSEASSSSSEDEDEISGYPAVRYLNGNKNDDRRSSGPLLKLRTSHLEPPATNGVPFPRSSPLSSPLRETLSPFPSPTPAHSERLSPLTEALDVTGLPVDSSAALPLSASNPIYSPYKYSPQDGTAFALPLRPSPVRSSSSPHILSNGRPLKSSLKSSSSASNIPSHQHTSSHHVHVRHIHSAHQRASSAPSTPADYNDSTSSSPSSSSPSDSGVTTPTTPKTVHFPSLSTHLERVRIFHKSAKPASLLDVRSTSEETETETDTDRGSDWGYGYRGPVAARSSQGFPFPKIHNSSPLSSNNSVWPPLPVAGQKGATLELDMAGYPVPDPSSLPPLPTTNILLESVSLCSSGLKEKLHVQGAFIVRNLNFHKDVTLRFTLDNWDTISEVKALWVANFPSPFAVQRSSIKDNHSWDRFSFSINLSDYPLASLPSKTLYFVGKYTVPGAEYWDNCGGRNWRIKFKVAKADASAPESVPSNLPNVVVSPPTASPAVMTATSVSSSMTPTPSSPTPIATPSPGHTEAVAQATAQRLRRFSLSNYVAPGSSTPPARPARSGAEPKVESNDKVSTPISSSEVKDETISPENKQLLPVATSSSPRSQPNVVTPPISSSVSPLKSESSSTPATPPVEANSESLYNWFVQQWCFAGIPSALPDHGSRPIEHGSRGSFGLDIEGGR